MNILFITIVWPEENENNIFTDLMQEFVDHGHNVHVVCARERRTGNRTEYIDKNGLHLLRVRCGNIQKTNIIEKGISVALLNIQMMHALKKYLTNIKFDLILCSTPPITLSSLINKLKQKYKAKVYLLLKDIWPQGPVDIGGMRKGSLPWKYFRAKERQMYQNADFIGCMSPFGVRYLVTHNPDLTPANVEECPNSIRLRTVLTVDRDMMRKKYQIPDDATVFVFGGNLGKPQGLHFLIDVIKTINGNHKVYFLIVGSGTHYSMISEAFAEFKPSNAALFDRLPKDEYDKLVRICDVGLILLDKRYTIPHFPSRILSYLEVGIPILCAANAATDIGRIVEEAGCGRAFLHGDLKGFTSMIQFLAENPEKIIEMGRNARKLLENRYTTDRAYKIIMCHFDK